MLNLPAYPLVRSGSLDFRGLPCSYETLFSLRSKWYYNEERCHQKLPFELWIHMKAKGSANDTDADHVESECLIPMDIGVVELVASEDWNTTIMDDAPGKLLRKSDRAATYLVESPLDFEAMCEDDQVTKVSRITASSEKHHVFPPRKSERRLKNSVSEAAVVHGVPALISGLEKLGCQRTTGEDQTLCIMSDSFNTLGGMLGLQESGDLPPDEFLTIVEELPSEFGTGLDEGSAMMELAYDIANGASFKFNTMVMGKVMAADDIIKLGFVEGCDIIVDDIYQDEEPGFRDGIISEAVNEVVEAGQLYFSSAGNYRNGYKFTSNWTCAGDLFGDITDEPCDGGVASHVFNPEATGIDRYRLQLDGSRFAPKNHSFLLHWDDDEGTSRIVSIELWIVDIDPETGSEVLSSRSGVVSAFGTAIVGFTLREDFVVGDLYYITISQHHSNRENVEMRLMSRTGEIFSDFSDGSIFAHKCAASSISVAAFDSREASGEGDTFADPEEGPVTFYSSRGPCYINTGSGLEERLKPVTTAATGLQTSTNPDVFATFTGTSASAPVAAAIATIVRAACFPKVVTYDDIMEMLSDYTYTIDVTSDADGKKETWGTEAGYGIISADQMLGWIAANCQESCPGG